MNNFLFWAHVLLTPFWVWGQSEKMLHSTQGVSIAMFTLAGIYTGIVTWLAVDNYRKQRDWPSKSIVILYILGVTSYVILVAVAFMHGYKWDGIDTAASVLAVSSAYAVIATGKQRKLAWHDPLVRGWLAFFVRIIPNGFMAYKILVAGTDGVSWMFIVLFNALTLLRIGQILIESANKGWNRPRIGLIIGESGNELSFLAVTVIWNL